MFRAHVLFVRRSKFYYTASGILTLKQVSGLKLLKITKITKIQFYKNERIVVKFYYYAFILIELYFSNFSYFSNFRPLTCLSVMIPEAV